MADLPKMPVTSGDMTHNRTGLWRYLMPVIHDRIAPCQTACPLGMPSPDFINDLIRQDAAGALSRILEINPLPGLTGRLCYHPCQTKCLRRGLDTNVQIQMLERYLADTAPTPPSAESKSAGAHVAILGAGPLGLGAAYFLGRMGVSVTVCDPLDRPGGYLTSLTEDKLPAAILQRECNRLVRLAGIRLTLGSEYSELLADSGNHEWRLIFHDTTAHVKDSGPAQRLSMLEARISPEVQLPEPAGGDVRVAYKASQIAMALAAGRDVAAQVLDSLGLHRKSDELNGVIQRCRADNGVSTGDIRYEFFEAQDAGATANASTDEQVMTEAKRCLSCGHCNLCGRCLIFCPDVSLSINEQGTRPEVDEIHCKGCGICAHECPRQAIEMER